MRLIGPLVWKTVALALLLSSCRVAYSASFEQSDVEAARAIKTGNVAEVKRIFADSKRVESIESNIFVLEDVYTLAVESGSVPLLEYLDSRGWLARLQAAPNIDKGSIVLIAAMAGHDAVLDYLASQRVDLSAPDLDTGNTAMHGAVSAGQLETVKHLCGLGLRPDVRSRAGKSVLELAEYNLRVSSRGSAAETAKYKESLRQIVAYLKEKGPDGCTAKTSSAAVAATSVRAGGMDRTIGACAPIENSEAARGTAVQILDPGLIARSYMRRIEQREIAPGGTITVQKGPAHGALKDLGRGAWLYSPATGYFGADRATVTVETSGMRIAIVFYLNVVPQVREAAEDDYDVFKDKKMCPQGKGEFWRIEPAGVS